MAASPSMSGESEVRTPERLVTAYTLSGRAPRAIRTLSIRGESQIRTDGRRSGTRLADESRTATPGHLTKAGVPGGSFLGLAARQSGVEPSSVTVCPECPRRDLNSHATSGHAVLSRACLPFHHRGLLSPAACATGS